LDLDQAMSFGVISTKLLHVLIAETQDDWYDKGIA
jgi:hypothetical protein